MALITLFCPLDNLVLAALTASELAGTDVVRDGAVGGHIHVAASGTAACLNGHVWRLRDDFLLERAS